MFNINMRNTVIMSCHIHSKQSPGGFPRKFRKFTGKHLCQSLFFNKVAGLLKLLAKDSGTGVFL